jgi:NAD(P)H-dependent flavin oxidoreductase YrpB (nitropropane dioxygenase family)
MNIPHLKIGKNLKADKPIIQGGMAVRVSTHSLASSVANCGGIGVIAGSGMALEELRDEIRTARKNITNSKGLLGVNIMFAARAFSELVNVCIEEKVDLIISGAGFSRDMFKVALEHKIDFIPIVSSVKLAVLAKKLGASAIIVESGEAGGHLGTEKSIRELIPEVRAAIDEVESPILGKERISLIAAGGVSNGHDIVEIMKLGADGVQMATRFVLTHECNVSEQFKQVLLNAKEEDIVIVRSPVKMMARAIKTPFAEKIIRNQAPGPEHCEKCLKHCSYEYCIIKALNNSKLGDYDNGLFFSGSNVWKYNDIISVEQVFKNLISEMIEVFEKEGNLIPSN